MKHPLSTLDTFSFRRHEGFTKQDGNTRFCSSNELETEKRNSRCWRSRSFEWSPPKLRTWAGWGYVFFSCQMSKGSFMDRLCLNLNAVRDCFSPLDHNFYLRTEGTSYLRIKKQTLLHSYLRLIRTFVPSYLIITNEGSPRRYSISFVRTNERTTNEPLHSYSTK